MFKDHRLFRVLTAALVLLLGAAPAAATEQRPLFRLGGLDFGESDLPADLRQKVFEAYDRYRASIDEVVRDAVFELHVEEQARASGRSPEAVRAGLLPDGPVPDADVEQFYRGNQQRIRAPFAQVRDQIAEFLADQRAAQARQQVVDRLRAAGELDDLLPVAASPQVRIDTAGFPSKGPADAPVTVVEFADYQCPHCKAAAPHVAALLERYPEQVRVVFMDFPVNRSGISRKVALGAVCADEQQRFWDYHDRAFARQSSLDASSPAALAAELGLDMARFQACYDSPQTAARVGKAEAEAQRLGLTGTPTLYINGQRLRVTRGMGEDLDAAVRAALEGSGA